MVENERGRNVLAGIDATQRAIREAIAAQPKLLPKPTRKEKPRKNKLSRGKPRKMKAGNISLLHPRGKLQDPDLKKPRIPLASVPSREVYSVERGTNEGLRQRFPGVALFIDQLRNPQIRTHIGLALDDVEVQLAMLSMERHIRYGDAEKYRSELAGAIFHEFAFQLREERRRESNAVFLKPSEVKGMLLGKPNVPDGLVLIPSEDGKSTEIFAGHQDIYSRDIQALEKFDTMIGLMHATSGSVGSIHISDYLQKHYPHLPQQVTVDRYFNLYYVLPADFEAPKGISERDIDRVPLSGRDLGILVTRIVGDLRSVRQY